MKTEEKKVYTWRLPSGYFYCHEKSSDMVNEIPNTPYINRAKFFDSKDDAQLNKPIVSFDLKLCAITITCEEVIEEFQSQDLLVAPEQPEIEENGVNPALQMDPRLMGIG